MKLVVGLGNPGPEYAWSRHNAGWLLVDFFVARVNPTEPRMNFGGAFWPASIQGGERVAFLKPFTYMNLSGKSVAEAAAYFSVAPADILIVLDDAAIPFGSLRYRASGSAGGQKGLVSIIASLGTLDVPRFRVGIGSPDSRVDMKDWVLGKFPKTQRDEWRLIEALAWGGFERWISGSAGDGFTVRIDERKDGVKDSVKDAKNDRDE
ncbi:MAG: aminoacyl-tRNA hydrolase [Synergistaceae bacterium]|jgi:PTH1 family peptidyl-tRNA hydrolase|nr:aminoacyl-tRNA hydrolase [Synergistaceae bacterium]